MIANSIQKNTGCGCGGSSSVPLAPCSCGGAGCASCQAQGFVRPRFFAGQLLTEDDLQLLTEYVGQKNRLHNRYLFGEGVACGLEVTCHPCGDGQVIVHPGYALDCCGNDLVLPCAKTLDINAMVRDLRRDQLGGFDCVDPCPPPPTKCEDGAAEKKQVADTKETKPPARKYCLYIRYCEQPSDPVMPYSTGDDCGRLVCEPTRVREGIRFELRCKPMSNAGHPLIARLCSCLGDLRNVKILLEQLKQLRTCTDTAHKTLATDAATFTNEDISPLKGGLTSLNGILEKIRERGGASRVTAETVERPPAVGRPVISPELIRDVSKVALLVNKFMALSSEQRNKFREQIGDDLSRAQQAVEQVRQILVNESKSPFYDVHDWLLERLNQSPLLTDCKLRGRIVSMVLPSFGQQIGATGTQSLVSATRPLIEASLEYLRDCICRALNPACEPCEDSAVLLACLDVEECDVIKICNMDRRFVLSPAAVRYWLPPLQLAGNIAERLCCESVESLLDMIPDGEIKKEGDFETLLKKEITRMLRDSLCTPSDITFLTDLMSDIGIDSKADAAQRISTEAAPARRRRGGKHGRPN